MCHEASVSSLLFCMSRSWVTFMGVYQPASQPAPMSFPSWQKVREPYNNNNVASNAAPYHTHNIPPPYPPQRAHIIPLMQCGSSSRNGRASFQIHARPQMQHALSATLNEPLGAIQPTVFTLYLIRLTWHTPRTASPKRICTQCACVWHVRQHAGLMSQLELSSAPAGSARCFNFSLPSCSRPPSRLVPCILSVF